MDYYAWWTFTCSKSTITTFKVFLETTFSENSNCKSAEWFLYCFYWKVFPNGHSKKWNLFTLTIKIPDRYHQHCFCVFMVNFEQISHLYYYYWKSFEQVNIYFVRYLKITLTYVQNIFETLFLQKQVSNNDTNTKNMKVKVNNILKASIWSVPCS